MLAEVEALITTNAPLKQNTAVRVREVLRDMLVSIDAGAAGGGIGGLPSWWTVDSTPGSESVEFTGQVVLQGQVGRTDHLLKVLDENGDLVIDIDYAGAIDTKRLVVQSPPDTGVDAFGHVSINPGQFKVIPKAGTSAFYITNVAGNTPVLTFQPEGYGDILEISPGLNTDTPLVVIESAAPTVDQIQVWDNGFNNRFFRVLASGAYATAAHAAPADADLDAGAMAVWFDQTNGAAKLMIKAKSADGTVATGQVALA